MNARKWVSHALRAAFEKIGARAFTEMEARLRAELRRELETELRDKLYDALYRREAFPDALAALGAAGGALTPQERDAGRLRTELRAAVRTAAGLAPQPGALPDLEDLFFELRFLKTHARQIAPVMQALSGRRVLFAGQAYYNAWYLSRELRTLGWTADVLDWDPNPGHQLYYHGADFTFEHAAPDVCQRMVAFYVEALYGYDVVHFSNAHGIAYGYPVATFFAERFEPQAEARLVKALGRKIAYSINGCLDGVSQTSFSKWGPESVCATCSWRARPEICSDERNLAWGRFRNEIADLVCGMGNNRVDYNAAPQVRAMPEFYCLDPELWRPGLEIPERYRLPSAAPGTVRVFHAVGNMAARTSAAGVNIKSTHVWHPLIEKLRKEGLPIELLGGTGMPNRELRYLHAQADVTLDMLTFGTFGAIARESMMLGKPVICFLRPEWMALLARELPEYVAELPVVSATPQTAEAVLRGLIADPERRREIGARSRAFAEKWHSAGAGARRFDAVYRQLLGAGLPAA